MHFAFPLFLIGHLFRGVDGEIWYRWTCVSSAFENDKLFELLQGQKLQLVVVIISQLFNCAWCSIVADLNSDWGMFCLEGAADPTIARNGCGNS